MRKDVDTAREIDRNSNVALTAADLPTREFLEAVPLESAEERIKRLTAVRDKLNIGLAAGSAAYIPYINAKAKSLLKNMSGAALLSALAECTRQKYYAMTEELMEKVIDEEAESTKGERDSSLLWHHMWYLIPWE